MEKLSDKLLMDTYKKANYLGLDKDFISLIETELIIRNLLSPVQKQINKVRS